MTHSAQSHFVTHVFVILATACSADYSTSSTSVTFASGETTSSVLRMTANSNSLRQGVTSLNVAMEFPDDPNVNFHVLVTKPGTLRADLVDDDCEWVWLLLVCGYGCP